jgi:hypothetical protein
VTIEDVSGTASPLETSVAFVHGCTYALKVPLPKISKP